MPSFLNVLLLAFALIAGVLINYPHFLEGHPDSLQNFTQQKVPLIDFQQQIVQAIDELQVEVNTEKENLQKLAYQIQELFDSVDKQKQKLQQFIEETHERFKNDYPTTHALLTPVSQEERKIN